MKLKLTFFILFVTKLSLVDAQSNSEESKIFAALKPTDQIPTTLLATRSTVFFDETVSVSELTTIQKGFQQMGIDAVAYFNLPKAMAGVDFQWTTAKYLIKRDIKFLIFVRKNTSQYEIYIAPFNGKKEFVESIQQAWFSHDGDINKLLRGMFQQLIGAEKRQNFLINDLPEFHQEISPFGATRNETLANDIGYFSVALPKFGNDKDDRQLIDFLKQNYSGKYEIVDPSTEESELRKKGFLFVLRYVHAKGFLAKGLLGYEVAKSENAIASAIYIDNQLQLKTIPSSQLIYKFYFKNLEYQNVFLGKWDADTTWQEALKNHLNAYKFEKKLK